MIFLQWSSMIRLNIIFLSAPFVFSDNTNNTELSSGWPNLTRRIIRGNDAGDTRPYMVYLRPASTARAQVDADWLCGGVIIDERYILTSAACIEDVSHFYVISGMRRWVSAKETDNECVNNGAKKAVWKCVPKSYIYDGEDYDNIRWMANDIAVVKVEEDFNFSRRVKGCDYVPSKIPYNNKSKDYEKPGTTASIAGWGSLGIFSDVITTGLRSNVAQNSDILLDAEVTILSKKNCKKRWHERYHDIIDKYMICGKDGLDAISMSLACSENEVNCKDIHYSGEDDDYDDADGRKAVRIVDPSQTVALSGRDANKRRAKPISGGFCENDHGGPLVVGHGKTTMVIGVISASQVRDAGSTCFGPFLYTSVYNNRHLIGCAIHKEMGATCRNVLRSSRTQMVETFFDWKNHPDGPSKSDTVRMSKIVTLKDPSNQKAETDKTK